MKRLQALLSMGLVSTIVSLEILGLTTLTQPLMPPSDVAIAAPRRPYRRASGAKRGVCPTPTSATPITTAPIAELMAFLPAQRNVADLTTTNAPSFHFYVPDQSDHIANLEFRLDYASGPKRGKGVLNPPLNVPIAKTPGVVKVQLPPILEKSTTYAWSLTLRCQKTGETVSFKGTVIYQDLAAPIATQLAEARSAQARAAIYAQAGFWLDAVPVLMTDGEFQAKGFEAMIAESGLNQP
jgi:Domain of Unknown Function (DUF928)